MKVGDIYWAELPEVGGREQHGLRLVVVLQDKNYTRRLPTILVVPLTSTRAALQFAGTLPIAKTAQNGLSYDSVLLVFQIRVLDKNRFHERMGELSAQMLDQIFAELDRLSGRTSQPGASRPAQDDQS